MSGSSQDNASLNDEDETIRQLDESGDLGAVVGSQSMLTQEIATLDDKDDTPTNEQASMAALLSQQPQDDPEADSPSNSQPPSVVSEDNGLSRHKQPDDDTAGVSCTHAGGTQDDAADPDETVFHSETGASTKRKRRGDLMEAAEKPPEYEYQHRHYTRRRRLLVEEQVKSLQDEKTLQDTLINSNMGSLLDAVQLLEDAAAAREAGDKDDTSHPLSQPAIVENLLPYSQESIQDSQRAVERLLDDDDQKRTPDYSKPPFAQPARKSLDEHSSATAKSTKSNNKANKKTKVHRHVQRAKKRAEFEKLQQQAQRAVELAQSAIHDEELGKQLLYRMALVRENPRTPPDSWPPADTTIPDGFFWAHYPPLEGVLKEHMKEYYKYSMELCQSGYQQAFNNRLVETVLKVATEHQWNFGPRYTHKVLRDRIRCYYKTHIQNAKKRLRTMLRNPTKRANARHLCQHLELLDEYQRATRGGQTPASPNEPSKKESPKNKKTPKTRESATEKENRKVASDDDTNNNNNNNNKKPSSSSSTGTITPKVASTDLCQQAIRVSQV